MDLATENWGADSPLVWKSPKPISDSRQKHFSRPTRLLELGPNRTKGELVFTWNSPEGLQVIERMTFYAETYRMDVSVQMVNRSSPLLREDRFSPGQEKYRPPPAAAGWPAFPVRRQLGVAGSSFTALVNKELHEVEIADLKPERRFDKNVQWGGFQDTYFLAALVPQRNEGTELLLKKISDQAAQCSWAAPRPPFFQGPSFPNLMSCISPQGSGYSQGFWLRPRPGPGLRLV